MEGNVMGELGMHRAAGTKPNFGDMARRHGLDRRTVAKYRREGGGQRGTAGPTGRARSSARPTVEAKAVLPGATRKGAHEMPPHPHNDPPLPGYGAFTAWCRRRGVAFGSPSPEAHPRFETPPGRQLRLDWREDVRLADANGEVLELNVWSGTLGHSRRHRFMPTRTRAADDLLACLLDALLTLGGVPEECVTDDTSALAAFSGGRRRKAGRAWRFAEEAGFGLVLCRPGTPETRGEDESANRSLSRLRAYEGELTGWEGLLECVARIEPRSNEEPDETTGLPPNAPFVREKESLGPIGNARLPQPMVGDVSVRTVPPTMLVRAAGRQWSVPGRRIGGRVTVVAMPGGQVRVRMGGDVDVQ